MIKLLLSIITLTLSLGPCIGQTRQDVDLLITASAKTRLSKDISQSIVAKQLKEKGKNILPVLATFFTDTTATPTYSNCIKRRLRKGEVAMILADQIEAMPYFEITQIQNCLLEFCPGNPNLIEFYFYPAFNAKYTVDIQKRYLSWLNSRDRRASPPHQSQKKHK